MSRKLRLIALLNGTDVFTFFGWLFAWCAGARLQRRGGVWLAAGGRLYRWLGRHPYGPMQAMVVGRVILAQDERALSRHLRHEWTHVRQFLRWGALFPLLYSLESLWCMVRGRDAYADNRFEREACSAECRR